MRVSSYSKADAIEQRDVINSGVRGTKDRNLRTGVGCTFIVPIMSKPQIKGGGHLYGQWPDPKK
jgi:hypothetical protein